jgi:hypothetical protein
VNVAGSGFAVLAQGGPGILLALVAVAVVLFAVDRASGGRVRAALKGPMTSIAGAARSATRGAGRFKLSGRRGG